MNDFTRDYYENGARLGLSLYTDYRWLPELTIPMAENLAANLGLARDDAILDFGCAKGYVVKALHHLGFKGSCGCDISEYAISQAPPEMREFLFLGGTNGSQWDWILAKDVLEHLNETDCRNQLAAFRRITDHLFIAVPLGDGNKYVISEMECDVTHKIRQPLWWWSSLVEEAGFKIVSSAFTMPGVKENWTRKHPFGNGFIIAQ